LIDTLSTERHSFASHQNHGLHSAKAIVSQAIPDFRRTESPAAVGVISQSAQDDSDGFASQKRPLKKFKLNPKFPHHRSDGLTWRRNRGSKYQVGQKSTSCEGADTDARPYPRPNAAASLAHARKGRGLFTPRRFT
jgi:hypothetical protein